MRRRSSAGNSVKKKMQMIPKGIWFFFYLWFRVERMYRHRVRKLPAVGNNVGCEEV